MLKVLNKNHNAATVQFTGSDLKKWYAENGEGRVYICHVLEKVVTDANVCRKSFLTPNSHDLIDQFRELVPSRFKVKKSASSVLAMHLKKKYHSRSQAMNNPFHTRRNFLKYIPDDHVFTVEFD